MKIPVDQYKAIEELIQSNDSPVGIDAKKTHVYIIHMLQDIQRRLEVVESRLGQTLAHSS